jgi:hypothetical protein
LIHVDGRKVRNHLTDLCKATLEFSIRALDAIETSFDNSSLTCKGRRFQGAQVGGGNPFPAASDPPPDWTTSAR